MAKPDSIPFQKMQGTGNDFIVIDNRELSFSLNQLIELTPKICHRKYGVGADGLLALQKPTFPSTDFEMIYRNADGSDAGMCGNGSRCLALYASQLGLGKNLTFSVHDNIYSSKTDGKEEVTIQFPIAAKIQEMEIDGERLWQVFTGTEHVVKEITQEELQNEDRLIKEGRNLRRHSHFQPKGTNVNFITGEGKQSLEIQTYERGVENLTLACGTGAIASALVWHHRQDRETTDNIFTVATKGGILNIKFDFDEEKRTYENIQLAGPAHFVFEGAFYV